MNKFRVLFAILMVMTMLFTLATVPVFADTADTGDSDSVASDSVVSDSAASEAAAETTVDDGWTTLGTSDFIALFVAAVILVVFVVAIVLLAPKKTKQR